MLSNFQKNYYAGRLKKKRENDKVRHRAPHLYLDLQKGGNIPMFHGIWKCGGFSLWFLKPLIGTVSKSLFRVGKNILKKAAPDIMHTALAAGNEILQGKSVKKTTKGALRNASRSLARNTRQSIEQELAQHGRCRTWGGRGLVTHRIQKLKKLSKK